MSHTFRDWSPEDDPVKVSRNLSYDAGYSDGIKEGRERSAEKIKALTLEVARLQALVSPQTDQFEAKPAL